MENISSLSLSDKEISLQNKSEYVNCKKHFLEKKMSSTVIVDLEKEKGSYHIQGIHRETGDRITKFCLNPSCYIFGLISERNIVEKFLKKNPEFILKQHNVPIEGRILDIVEIKEEIAKLKEQADEGDHKAQYEIGKLYEEGSSRGEAGQSIDLAIKYYQMAKKSVPEANDRVKELLKVYGIIRDTCSVCLERFSISNNFCSTICGHQFHLTCLMEVMKTRDNCPICRKKFGYKCAVDEEKKQEELSEEEEIYAENFEEIDAANFAAEHGRIDTLNSIEQERGVLPTFMGANGAAGNGHLDVLNWLEQRHILPTHIGAHHAAENGHLDVLNWLEQRHILPASYAAIDVAENGHLDVLNWLEQRHILPSHVSANRVSRYPDVLNWISERHIEQR
jgi:Ring finger domain